MHPDYRKALLAELARIDQQIADCEALTASECDDATQQRATEPLAEARQIRERVEGKLRRNETLRRATAKMFRSYFIAGNAWLFVAFICYVGKTWERSQPTMYSLFGTGRLFYPWQYAAITAIPLTLSAVCFWLYWQSSSRLSFQFSFRALLIAFTFAAVLLALIIISGQKY